MKKRVIIIGGGVIARHYADGLKNSSVLEAVALCDLNEDCPARACFSSLPFYKDYGEAIAALSPDAAIVATSVKAHLPIAKDCMDKGLDVYVEKPITGSQEELVKLYQFAQEKGKNLTALFHWQYADEVLFLKEYLQGKKIEKIAVRIGDDYACEPLGKIRKDRLGLDGAWMDSGINALSYVHVILPLTHARLINKLEKVDESCGLPYFTKRVFDVDGAALEIVVDWTDEGRKKTSELFVDGKNLHVNHSNQQVFLGEQLLYEKKVADRLAAHYQNMFYQDSIKTATVEESKLLHEILLRG